MKIMFLATTYFPHVGGLEQVVRSLGQTFQREGHAVVVVTDRRPWRLPGAEQRDGVTIVRLPFVAAGVSLKGSLMHPLVRLYTMACLRRFARALSIDVIHLQGVSRNAPYGVELARATGIPLVATFHGAEVEGVHLGTQPPRIVQWQRRQLAAVAAQAAALTTVSSDLAAQLTALVPEAVPKLRVIGNALDPSDLGLPPGAPPAPPDGYLLGVGRFVAKKGFDVLLRAYALLRAEQGAAPGLVLVGDGPERPALEALARQLGVANAVRWEGMVADRRRLGCIYTGSRLCVVPSRHEPFGLVCLEALAAGRPVVASAVGGIPETVRDGVDGLLVPPDDPVALAAAVGRVLGGAVGLASTAALSARAETFSWPLIAGRYLELYRSVLARPA